VSELLLGHPTHAELADQLSGTTWRPRGKGWMLAFGAAGLGTAILFVSIWITVSTGIGAWGNDNAAGWAFGILHFVWWIGIGHAGTFISAILFLLEQKWRTSINRFAEAMTLFAVVQAAMFPILHLGRPWFAYWLVPYPSILDVWPQFKSALPWDAAAIATYGTVSLLFWYLGLLPDFAKLRDLAPTRARRLAYGVLALGWRGSARGGRHVRVGYALLAGLATPLVVSVHSIVSSDFAITLVPGWHSTIFPPFFVAGAILSGFAMVVTLLIPARRVFGIENVVTLAHLDALAKMILVTANIVVYAYAIELFVAWYSGDPYEAYHFFVARPHDPSRHVFWTMIACNAIVPQLLWSARVRKNLTLLWVLSILVNVGMWAERYVIVVGGLERGFLPSGWADYSPTLVDVAGRHDRLLPPPVPRVPPSRPLRGRDRGPGARAGARARSGEGACAWLSTCSPSSGRPRRSSARSRR
jgi:molybdopterin-containing oxidoreductase family membrane subunit